MYLKKVERPRAVTLPDGSSFSLADLPDRNTRRWVASRKAAVVRGVLYGLITEADAEEWCYHGEMAYVQYASEADLERAPKDAEAAFNHECGSSSRRAASTPMG